MKKAAILVQVLALLTLISLLPSCKTIEDEGIVHINLDDALENPSDFKLSDIVKDAEKAADEKNKTDYQCRFAGNIE